MAMLAARSRTAAAIARSINRDVAATPSMSPSWWCQAIAGSAAARCLGTASRMAGANGADLCAIGRLCHRPPLPFWFWYGSVSAAEHTDNAEEEGW